MCVCLLCDASSDAGARQHEATLKRLRKELRDAETTTGELRARADASEALLESKVARIKQLEQAEREQVSLRRARPPLLPDARRRCRQLATRHAQQAAGDVAARQLAALSVEHAAVTQTLADVRRELDAARRDCAQSQLRADEAVARAAAAGASLRASRCRRAAERVASRACPARDAAADTRRQCQQESEQALAAHARLVATLQVGSRRAASVVYAARADRDAGRQCVAASDGRARVRRRRRRETRGEARARVCVCVLCV